MQPSTETQGRSASCVADETVHIRHDSLSEGVRSACEKIVALASVDATLSGERLGEIIESMSCAPDEFTPYVKYDSDEYCRNVLAESERAQLVLIGWAPGQYSPAHDHGGDAENRCAVRVISGCGVEQRFELDTDGELVASGEERITQGDMVLNDGPDIHVLGCDESCTEPLVTLHLYTPPLCSEDMNIFEDARAN